MSNVVVFLKSCAINGTYFVVAFDASADNGIATSDVSVNLDPSVIQSPPSTINDAILTAATDYLLDAYGVVVEPGDRTHLFGGIA